jgi:hypothetical protein
VTKRVSIAMSITVVICQYKAERVKYKEFYSENLMRRKLYKKCHSRFRSQYPGTLGN